MDSLIHFKDGIFPLKLLVKSSGGQSGLSEPKPPSEFKLNTFGYVMIDPEGTIWLEKEAENTFNFPVILSLITDSGLPQVGNNHVENVSSQVTRDLDTQWGNSHSTFCFREDFLQTWTLKRRYGCVYNVGYTGEILGAGLLDGV